MKCGMPSLFWRARARVCAVWKKKSVIRAAERLKF
jgi:hypothetical protein